MIIKYVETFEAEVFTKDNFESLVEWTNGKLEHKGDAYIFKYGSIDVNVFEGDYIFRDKVGSGFYVRRKEDIENDKNFIIEEN